MFTPVKLCRFRVLLVNNSSRKSANLSPPSNNVPIKNRYSFSARHLFRKTDVVDKPGSSHSVAAGYPQTFFLVPFRFLHQIFIPTAKTSLTFGTILCIADVSQQYLMIKLLKLREEMKAENGRTVAIEKKLDWKSAWHCFLIGTLALGPLYHFWYRYLDSRFPSRLMKTVLLKCALDEAIIGPPTLVIFLGAFAIFNDKNVLNEIRTKFVPGFIAELAFWPLCQMINFRYIPPLYRVAFLGFGSFVFDNFICFLKDYKVENDLDATGK